MGEDIDINSLSMPYLIILSAFYLYLAIKVVFGHRVQFTWRVSAVRKELRLSLPTETELLWHKSFPFQTLIILNLSSVFFLFSKSGRQ